MTLKRINNLIALLDFYYGSKITIQFLSGYVAAVIVAPMQINPDRWMQFLLNFNRKKIRFKSVTEEEDFLSLIAEFFNHITDTIKKWNYNSYISSADSISQKEGSLWCDGFLLGVTFWGDAISFMNDPKILHPFSNVVYIHSPQAMINDLKQDSSIKKEWNAEVFNQLPHAIPEIRRHFVKKNLISKKPYYITTESLAS